MAGKEEYENCSKTDIEQDKTDSSQDKLIRLPITRIKHIIKTDPDVSLASQEAVITLAKAAELFIQLLSKDAIHSTLQGKRKTLQRKDLDRVLEKRDCYAFLEGAMDS